MAKPRKRKPGFGRKPPVPSDLHPIAKRLDESIRETLPELQYAVKWKKAFVFFGGAEFDPPPPLGTAERTRYVKVKTLEEAQGTEMHAWIQQAGRVPGWQ